MEPTDREEIMRRLLIQELDLKSSNKNNLVRDVIVMCATGACVVLSLVSLSVTSSSIQKATQPTPSPSQVLISPTP